MQSRTSKITVPAVSTRYPLATPLTMVISGSFVNSDLEAPLLFGWRATSGKRETRVESSPSRQCAPMFPPASSRARSPNWLFPKNFGHPSPLPSLSTCKLSIIISSSKVRTAPTYFSYSLSLAPASMPYPTHPGELLVVDDYVQTWQGRSRNKQRWRYTACTTSASFMGVSGLLSLFQRCSCRRMVPSRPDHIKHLVSLIAPRHQMVGPRSVRPSGRPHDGGCQNP